MSRIAVFIDGAYLEFLLRQEFGAPKIDFELLVRQIAGTHELLRTYYYDCLPLAVDLVQLAAKRQVTDAALLAGDSDFLPAIEAAKSDGIVVHLFHGRAPHDELRICCDERTRIDRALIDSVRLVASQ